MTTSGMARLRCARRSPMRGVTRTRCRCVARSPSYEMRASSRISLPRSQEWTSWWTPVQPTSTCPTKRSAGTLRRPATSSKRSSAVSAPERREHRPGALAVEIVADVGVNDCRAVVVTVEAVAHRLLVREVQLADRRTFRLRTAAYEVLDVTTDRRMLHAGDRSVPFISFAEVVDSGQRRDERKPRHARRDAVVPVKDRLALVGALDSA